MKMSGSRASIFEALAKFQAEMVNPPKTFSVYTPDGRALVREQDAVITKIVLKLYGKK